MIRMIHIRIKTRTDGIGDQEDNNSFEKCRTSEKEEADVEHA